jgi:P4 family phage/plasmid primase-like protien
MSSDDEVKKFLLLCPICRKEVKEYGKDDIQTWYECPMGHKTAAPIKQELDGIGQFQKAFCEKVEKNPEIADYEPPEVVPGFDCFCDDDGRFIPAKLAEWIMGKYTLITMMDNEETFVYINGFYQPLGDVTVKKLVKETLRDEYRKNRAMEVLDYIKVSTYTTRREEPPHLIPLANGILDLSKNPFELKQHSSSLMFFNKIPVEYETKADSPLIKKFLKEISASEEDVEILLEVIAFALYRDYFLAKALMLVGGGANGKSTFLNLAKAFLGFENISSRSLQELELNRFAKADLQHKLSNVYADLPDKALQSTGTFKMLTGRDPITAEHKFKNSFQFSNYAKLMFSANKVPEAYDDTTAFFRRWIILVFPNEFKEDKADPHILDKIATKQELSGLLNMVIPRLKRLLEKGQFSYSKTTEEIKEDYIRKSSPIAAFVMDCLETDSDAFIIKKELYGVFTEYCRNRAIPMVTETTFFKNLPQHVAITDFKPQLSKSRIYTFRGIRYTPKTVSSMSNVSRVFYILSSLKENYQNSGYHIIGEYGDYIKIGITLDTLDPLDRCQRKLLSEHVCEDCELFHKPSCVFPGMNFNKVPEDSKFALDCRGFTPKKEASK